MKQKSQTFTFFCQIIVTLIGDEPYANPL